MYNLELAANYWGKRLTSTKDKNEAVAGLSRPSFINNGYTYWEKSIIKTVANKYLPHFAIDLCCGVGRLITPLLEANTISKVYAVDLTPEMLDLTKTQVSVNNINNKDIEIICSSSSSIDLPSSSLDFIMCMGLLEHLPQELQLQTLSEINRLLNKNGILLLEINNLNSIFLENGRDNPFRKSQQLDNGYFCSLIDKAIINEHLRSLNFEITATYSNPFFSIISHLLREIDNNNVSEELGNKWIDLANKLDEENTNDISNIVSDQIILEIKKIK